MTAQPVGTCGQQPITEEHALTLDPVDTRNVLEVDDLGMGAEEVVLHDRLDTIGIDAYSLENAGALIVKQQRVVIHACHPHGVQWNYLYGHILATANPFRGRAQGTKSCPHEALN